MKASRVSRMQRFLALGLVITLWMSTLVIRISGDKNIPTISDTEVTCLLLADVYETTGHISKEKGQLYLEKTLGEPYFDGVRTGDTLTFHMNVNAAGTYQWCMMTGWAKDAVNGRFSLWIDGQEASNLINQVKGVDWRTWLDTTHASVELSAGVHEVKVVFSSDGPNVYAIKFAPEGVEMSKPEGVVSLCQADSNTPVQVIKDYAIQFCTTVPFDYVTVAAPSYSNNKGSFRLELFAWKDNYDTTVQGQVLASQDYIDFNDNATLRLEFEPEMSLGEYVLRITNISDDANEQVGIWTSPSAPAHVRNYQNGLEISNAARMNLHYFGQTTNPLGSISVNAAAGAPVYEEVQAMRDVSTYHLPEDSLYLSAEMMPDTWVFTDALGRTALTQAEVGDVREGKTLALFYWIWHATFAKLRTPFNVQQFIDQQTAAGIPMESYIYDFNYEKWPSATGAQYFWNEPIYGYYRSDDTWVQRKQAELLAAAGVDVVFSDNTNATLVWADAYPSLYETWSRAQKDGVRTPKITYMMPFGAGSDTKYQLHHYYESIFHDGKYRSLWYYLDGKPMLMAYPQSLGSSVLDQHISEFFTFRPGQASYFTPRETGNWGWLSVYPQALHFSKTDRKTPEQIAVGVAQNANYVHMELAAMSGGPIMGRSYTSDRSHLNQPGSTLWGYNFAEQFEYALEMDPKVIFVTGWNEWCASRYESWPDGGHSVVTNAFPDQFNDEYSRDLEPSRGALGDTYYYQFVNFVRRYKGVRALPTPTAARTVDITAGSAAWADVGPYYAASIGNIGDRDADGYLGTHYTDTSGRNDIIGAQVARDDDYIYFHVECVSDITPYTDPLWMHLYIDCDQTQNGWNSFDYVINKSAASADTLVLEKFSGEGYASTRVADCAYTVDGRYLTVKVRKADLGLKGYDFTINFAWTDNVHDVADLGTDTEAGKVYTTFTGDILDFYTSGDVAPGGRFKYSYVSTYENAGVQRPADETDIATTTGDDVTEPTDPDTDALFTEAPTSSEPDTVSSQPATGCASTLPLGGTAGAVVVAGVAAGLATQRTQCARRTKRAHSKCRESEK